jgi:hypothetical protein
LQHGLSTEHISQFVALWGKMNHVQLNHDVGGLYCMEVYGGWELLLQDGVCGATFGSYHLGHAKVCLEAVGASQMQIVRLVDHRIGCGRRIGSKEEGGTIVGDACFATKLTSPRSIYSSSVGSP